MPNIVNIPRKFIDDHIEEHNKHGGHLSGGHDHGAEYFLKWHHDYIQEFRKWIDTLLPADNEMLTFLTSPWKEVPREVRDDIVWRGSGAQNDLDTINDQINASKSLNDLSSFITARIHAALHDATANAYNEPVLSTYYSPKSTYFWQLHGLIDSWRAKWESTHSC